MSAHAVERLAAYLDGELSARDRSEVEAHLGGCAACARQLEELAAVDAAVRDLPADAPPGYFESFPARVRARVGSRPRRAWWGPPVWYAAAAAAVMLAVLAPLTLRREPPPSAPAAETAPTPAAALDVAKISRTDSPPASAPPAKEPQERAVLADRRSRVAPVPPPGTLAKQEPAAVEAPPPEGPQAAAHLAQQAMAAPEAEAPRAPAARAQARRVEEPPGGRFASSPPAAAERDEGRAEARAADATAREGVAAVPLTAEDRAAAGGSGDDGAFRELSSRPARTATEARALREAWRAYALAHSAGARADEARVRVVESGVAAYRLGRDPEDLARARADTATYLRRKDAAQAGRVRGLLASLEP